MKQHLNALLLIFLALITIWLISSDLPEQKNEIILPSTETTEVFQAVTVRMLPETPDLAGDVIRLHILADSDSERDQAIKLHVRDMLLPYLKAATMGAKSKKEALIRLEINKDILEKAANEILAACGVDYTSAVSIETTYFPIRIYGSQTWLSEDAIVFPPGLYNSVQIILGSGKGHNWWCLAYPSLCFIDAAYDYIPKDSDLYRKELGTIKTSTLEELFYGHSTAPEDETITVYYGSKLYSLLKNLWEKMTKRQVFLFQNQNLW